MGIFSKRKITPPEPPVEEHITEKEVYDFLVSKHNADSKWELPGKKTKHYSLYNIMNKAPDAKYYMSFGARSRGKTTAGFIRAVARYILYGEQFAYVRRWNDDVTGSKVNALSGFLEESNFISDVTDGKFNSMVKRGSYFYLSYFDREAMKRNTSPEPIALFFSINTWERDKGGQYPKVKTIILDEFITTGMYINDEFIQFENIISTIVRKNDDIIIFMFANSICRYTPYFREMGIKNAKYMDPGTIDVYKYGDSGLEVAVEKTGGDSIENKSPSDIYFAFDNPKLKMITTGEWELDIYPRLPVKYNKSDIKFTYFIEFDDEKFQCDIVQIGSAMFTFIQQKTTVFKNEDKDLIFSQAFDPRYNWRRDITLANDNIGKVIYSQFVNEKVYYQDNEVGDTVTNYVNWCKNGRA